MLVSCTSPSYTKRENESGQKGHTNVSGWNAIIGNSSAYSSVHQCTSKFRNGLVEHSNIEILQDP